MIEVEQLRKAFGELVAVDGVSFTVRPGELFGLLGPNGAGKTTTIGCISGLLTPTAGRVRVMGHDVVGDGIEARRALGVVPQDIALYEDLSASENLQYWGGAQGMRDPTLRSRIAEVLELTGLQDRAREAVKKFSGGMKRRLNMAAGLIHRPKVMLMDEPTVGVDPQARNRIFEMIEELRGEGISMIYTTHYMEEAERLCDRIAIIDHGRIIALGTKDELVQNAFASRSEVLARFAKADDGVADWVKERGGLQENGMARFTIEHATEIAGLLESAAKAGHELADISLRKPNLESVFLHLTGRELRD